MKSRSSHVLTRWAELALARDRIDEADALGTEALDVATAMGRRSEVALALAVLADAADQQRRLVERTRHLAALGDLDSADLSAHARSRLRALEDRLGENFDRCRPIDET